MVIPDCFIYTSRRQDIKPSLTGLTVKHWNLASRAVIQRALRTALLNIEW